jgi:hypothetical protein
MSQSCRLHHGPRGPRRLSTGSEVHKLHEDIRSEHYERTWRVTKGRRSPQYKADMGLQQHAPATHERGSMWLSSTNSLTDATAGSGLESGAAEHDSLDVDIGWSSQEEDVMGKAGRWHPELSRHSNPGSFHGLSRGLFLEGGSTSCRL